MKRHPAVGDVYLENTDGDPGAVYLIVARDKERKAPAMWECLVLYPSLLWHEECQDVVCNTEAWLMNACDRLR